MHGSQAACVKRTERGAVCNVCNVFILRSYLGRKRFVSMPRAMGLTFLCTIRCGLAQSRCSTLYVPQCVGVPRYSCPSV